MDNKRIIISVKDLVVNFKVRSSVLTSIRNINLDIYEGETLALVGESGSGKSVFTKTFTNMIESNGWIESGSIIFNPPVEGEASKIQRTTDLVDFHNNMLDSNMRSWIIKKSKLEIKKLAARIVNLNKIKQKDLKDKIYKTQKLINLLEERQSFDSSNKDALNLLELKKDLKRYEFWNRVASEEAFKQKHIVLAEEKIHKLKNQLVRFGYISRSDKQMIGNFIDELKNFYKAKRPFTKEDKIIFKEYFDYKDLKPIEIKLKKIFEDSIIGSKPIDKELYETSIYNWKFMKHSSYKRRKDTRKSITNLRGATIATIFQDPMTSLNPLLTVGYQISEVLIKHRGLSRFEAKKEAIELLTKVGIKDADKRYNDVPGKYSGGMRQRVVIAIALACRPNILLCDEPTTALDVTIQAQILKLIKELQKEYKFTIIFITHDLGVVANIADRVAVMYAGQIVEYGTLNEVYSTPQHPYTWALLSSLPQLGEKGEELYSISGTPPSLFKKIKGDPFAPRNPYALLIDYKQEPPMFKVSETHYAKTWLLDKRAPKVDKPKQVEELKKLFTK
ncbi:oligopeptide ABC transporter ATP-binding protein [Spiroplasma sp. TIUS-1]|uniref:oligopeptide ABC transporter ATP-binding protein OppD n=1 Tax=Spiroplasma sp. TIUS-1 TaxID=216963 RepID=UPI001397C3AB|nr:oligopeptide ABC transporter ATP-binding protein OppD [Spiroplasma sp. TIUS-1]QHX36088.1 oligopeptide ABC transporter ATP-binding protein [Spiroplasma sp. TIUS-1]